MLKILFMGTPDFAVPSLKALAEAGHQVVGVVTQPDRPRGRGQKVTYSHVKAAALELNIPVYQPVKIKTPEFVEIIKELAPQLIVVVAFGQILSKAILMAADYGCINVHASLLPKYRGAAPIHWAVINGEAETGVTIMQMDEGLDTGDMLVSGKIPIHQTDTTGDVHDELAILGAELLIQAIEKIESQNLTPVSQNHAESTYAPLLTKDTEKINWDQSSRKVSDLVRGLNPWPGAYTLLDNKILKIWQAAPCSPEEIAGITDIRAARPGEVLGRVPGKGFAVAVKEGCIVIGSLQIEGGKKVSGEDFMNGRKIDKGVKLG